MRIKVHNAVASVMGIGFLPMAPGTWASLLGVALWYAAQRWIVSFHTLQWVLVLACVGAGMISIRQVTKKWGDDPSQVVIDELAGIWISCLLLPHDPAVLFTALIFFRLFDIFKPLGIRSMEKIQGAGGVMLDDMLAGVYSNLCVQGLLLLGVWNI